MTRKPTGKVTRTPRGADLIITRSFRADIEDVWESVTASDSTARWIGSWRGEPGPGKTVRFKMLFEEGMPESDARIERCEPPHHLVLSMSDEYGALESRAQVAATRRDHGAHVRASPHRSNFCGERRAGLGVLPRSVGRRACGRRIAGLRRVLPVAEGPLRGGGGSERGRVLTRVAIGSRVVRWSRAPNRKKKR